MQFIDIGGITLHHQLIGGPADKPVIVFANSLGTDFRIWRDVIVRLAGDFPIVTYDKRGHGLSDMRHRALFDGRSCRRSRRAARPSQGQERRRLRPVGRRADRAGALCQASRPGARRSSFATPPTRSARRNPGTPASPPSRSDGIASIADGVLKLLVHAGLPCQARPTDLAGYRNMLARQPVDGYAGTCAALRDADYTEAAKAHRGADALRRRRPGRLDPAGSGALAWPSSSPARVSRSSTAPATSLASSSRKRWSN